MKVITLYPQEFKKACQQLADKVSDSFTPDLVIGVLTGGSYVAKQVMQGLNCSLKYDEVKVQRTGTKKKNKGFLRAVLQSLPIFLLNYLRMLESVFLEFKSKYKTPVRNGTIALSEETKAFLSSTAQLKVLLVDDAIDTGATLSLIKEYLEDNYPGIVVKTAVITITMKNVMINADYYLFNNRTLIRFPWSNDIKNEKGNSSRS